LNGASGRATKLRTSRAIIERWTPKVENDTAAYLAVVARRIGV
jgi:hypothetical protein